MAGLHQSSVSAKTPKLATTMCLGAAAAAAAAGGVWLWGKQGENRRKLHDLKMHKNYLKYDLEELDEDLMLKEAHIQQLQGQLAAAHHQLGQNAAQAQEVTRLQREVADLQAEISNQAGIVRQNQQNRRELTQQHAAAQAERERLARELTSVATREHALVQRQAGQASAAAEEEARLVRQAQALDAQRAEFQAQLAEAKQEEETRQQEVLQSRADMQQQQCNLAERESRLVSQEGQHAAAVSAKEDEMRARSADLDRREASLKHEQDNLAAGQAQLAEESQEWASSKALVLQHKNLLSKREGELNRREEGIAARTAELSESKAKLDGLELIRMRGHEKKEKDLTTRQAALQGGEQQLHAEKARLAALEETLKSEYEVKSKACEAAAMISKKEVAAVVKEKSVLQQQLKEERQAHAKASQQQLDKHAIEVQDGQQRTAGASPIASSPIASITQLEDKVQAADRGLTPPPPPGLARPSGPVSLSSSTTGGRKGNTSSSSGMPTPNSPAVGSPQSQPGQQFQGTRDPAPALAPAARGGFGSGLRPDMLRRLGNGDGNPFGEHASRSDRGQGDRQADTNRPGLSNNVQTPPSSQGSSGSGGSDRGRGRGRGRHATAGGHFGGRQQQPPGGRL